MYKRSYDTWRLYNSQFKLPPNSYNLTVLFHNEKNQTFLLLIFYNNLTLPPPQKKPTKYSLGFLKDIL